MGPDRFDRGVPRMAKGKKGVDGIDKVIDLFPAGSHKMLARLLARAAERDAKAAGRNVKRAMGSASSGSRAGIRMASNLAAELGRALRHRGDVGGNRASIRQKAPDSGGRTFHFAHSIVNKGDAPPSASGKAQGGAQGAGGTGTGPTGAKGGKTGRAAAHMRYIEREIAVERAYGQGSETGREAQPGLAREGEAAGRDAATRERGDGNWDRSPGEGAGRDPATVHASGAGAGQGYIENPVKLANGEQVIFSYGTIGDRFEDRVRFWEALEEAEAHPSARVQHRLIVELPHEASAQARFEMVKAFTKRFDDDGVPYWAALHAPGKDNDSRNFHAHIVYSERPAKRMVDVEAPGAPERWDFEVTRTHRKKSRNLVTTRPYRQDKLRDYHARDFIPRMRAEFSIAVNAVLERDDVRDKSGAKVLYDARSYKDMGVDAVPMRSINRIVADKLKDGRLTVLDGDYTRRMIATELREAAAKRDRGVLDLVALDNALRATRESPRPRSQNAKLPPELRVSPWANPGKAAMRAASRKILEARHAALQVDVMERATTASLERIIAATAPKAVAAAAKARDPIVKGEAPSSEGARLLHAAALDELAETRASTARARRTMAYRVGAAVNEWKALVGAPPPSVSPAVRDAIRELDRREELAERGPSRATPERGRGRDDVAPDRASPATSRETGRVAGGGPATGARRTTAEVADRGIAGGDGATPRRPTAPRAGRGEGRRAADAATGPAGAREASRTGAEAPGPASRATAAPADLRPKSMEDSLGVRMPPTTAALAAASRTVSNWIKAIAEGEPDVDARMRRLDAFMEGLKASVRERQGRASPEPSARAAESTRVEGASTDQEQGRGAVAPGAEAARVVAKTSGDQGRVDDGETSHAGGAEPKRPGAAGGPTTEEGKAESATVAEAPKGVASTTSTGGDAGSGPTDGAAETPEDPDAARRRRKREEEIEKRKRKRQAVLGRRNRGRGR